MADAEILVTAGADILVVDDTAPNLLVLSSMLKEEGYRVRSARGGLAALRAIETQPPDLILLDIMMPEMDGYEVCARIKEQERLRDIPVIFISALGETDDKVKAFDAGGVDYVTKPFGFDEVRARVSTHLRLHSLTVTVERHNRELWELVESQVAEIAESQMSTIFALAVLAESRDTETGRHLERVQRYCALLGERLAGMARHAGQIDSLFIDNLVHASPLHDIGKVGIRDEILLKPGPLTPEEFEIMKTHTTCGAQTLETVRQRHPGNAFIGMGIDIARSHHERTDGGGYPDGLAGEEIPMSARIMALADVYDALRSKRAYKSALTHEESCAIIEQEGAAHFDPDVLAAFKELHDEFAHVLDEMSD